jgi:hypothetical protein
MSFPFTKQPDAMDCGPACICMIAEHYGKQYALEHLRDNCFIGREGVSMLGISKAAEKIGFHTVGGRLAFDKLAEKALLPCLTHVRKLLMETTGVCSLYLVLHPSSMTLNLNEWGFVPKSSISSTEDIEDFEDFNSEQTPTFSESVADLLPFLLSQIAAKAVLQSLLSFIPSPLCILSISPLIFPTSSPHRGTRSAQRACRRAAQGL